VQAELYGGNAVVKVRPGARAADAEDPEVDIAMSPPSTRLGSCGQRGYLLHRSGRIRSREQEFGGWGGTKKGEHLKLQSKD
jgi:hypothetical protein